MLASNFGLHFAKPPIFWASIFSSYAIKLW